MPKNIRKALNKLAINQPVSMLERLARKKDDLISEAGYKVMLERARRKAALKNQPAAVKSRIMPYTPTSVGKMSPQEYRARFGSIGSMQAASQIIIPTPEAEAPFSPADLPGLEGWWAADLIIGLNDSDPVETWPDESGNGHDATQGTAAAQPTYRTNIVNGKPIVRFDGVNDRVVTVDFGLTQPTTVFTVFQFRGSVTASKIISDGLDGSVTQNNLLLGSIINSGEFEIYAGIELGGPVIAADTWYLGYGIFNGASSEVRLNAGSATIGDAGSDPAKGVSLGAKPVGGSASPVDIAEYIVYNRVLSDSEREQVENYLMDKYAL